MAVTDFKRGTVAISNDFNNPEDIQAGNNGAATSKVIFATGEFIILQGFDFQVPTASIINGIEVRTKASRFHPSSTDSITVGLTASLQGTSVGEEFATDTFTVDNDADTPKVYTVGGENQFAGGQMHLLNYKNINQLRLRWETLVNDSPNERQLALTGSDSGDLFPAVRIHYTPLRWARVLTSGSNFPVSTLINSDPFKVIPQNDISSVNLTTANKRGHFKSTSSIAFRKFSSQTPKFQLNTTNTSRSLFISESTLTCSNIPQTISIPDGGDYLNDILFSLPKNVGSGFQPRGRVVKSPLIGIENVLTYEGEKSALSNNNLLTGSTVAPWIPTTGTQVENGITLNGSLVGFSGPNSGDVGYADYSQNDRIKIEFTSPNNTNSGTPQFFVTASFAIPYSASFGAPGGLDVFIVRKFNALQDAIEHGPFTLNFNGIGDPNPIGMFTGSVVIPNLTNDFLQEGEHLQLRVQNQSSTKPVHIAFTGSGDTAFFRLENEFNANLKPSVHVSIPIITTGNGGFVGEAWSASTASLAGIVAEPIPSDQALNIGDGLIFNRTPPSPANAAHISNFRGNQAVTASIKLNGQDSDGEIDQDFNPGLTFGQINDPTQQINFSTLKAGKYSPMINGGTNALVITSSLPGNGLFFDNNVVDILNIELSGSSVAFSNVKPGLKINNNGLALDDGNNGGIVALDGEGIDLTDGVLKVDLFIDRSTFPFINSGLEFDSGKLALDSSFTGNGLNFRGTNKNFIDVDFTQFVTSSLALTGSVPGAGSFPALPLLVGNQNASATNANALVAYSSSVSEFNNVLTYQYGFSTNLLHPDLSSISGSSLKINGNIILGDSLVLDDALLNIAQLNLSSSFPQLNVTTVDYTTSPYSKKRGGFIIPTVISTPTTGAAIFYDSVTEDNPFSDWEYQSLDSLGWALTTGSSVIKRNEKTNPFNPTNNVNIAQGILNSNPTSSFEHNNYVALPQTVKSLDESTFGANPNAVSVTSSLYETASMVNYGAICVIELNSTSDDSNVWMYVPKSAL